MNASAFRDFIDELHRRFADGPPGLGPLQQVADTLAALCAAEVGRLKAYPQVAAGQELLHELAVSPSGGPSLYLVSDGAGVRSPPHGHLTWAVTVGVSGEEINGLYQRDEAGRLRRVREVRIGPGDRFVMASDQVHSTEVAGLWPTCHVHLYGRSLASLPAFASRCQSADGRD